MFSIICVGKVFYCVHIVGKVFICILLKVFIYDRDDGESHGIYVVVCIFHFLSSRSFSVRLDVHSRCLCWIFCTG